MRVYHCVDLLNARKSEDIEASSPDAAMKRFFKMLGIAEKPVRSVEQTHQRKYDCRFYAETVSERRYRPRRSFTGFNREGYEFYATTDTEFLEENGRKLDWSGCGKLKG